MYTSNYIVKPIGMHSIFVLQGAAAVGIDPSKTTDKMTVGNPNADPSLSDASRTSESLRYQDTRSNILGESGDEDSDTDSDSSDYLSFDEDDNENVYPETKAERESRAHERQLVLEAAGLIVTQHDKPPPAVVRARSYKRRPAPLAPHKGKFQSFVSPAKELPPVPQVVANLEPEPINHTQSLDDAFDRYESFKNSQLASNRMSVASTISGEAYPPSPTASTTASRERDGEGKGYSYFLNFLGRSRTPEEKDKDRSANKLNISAPMMQGSGDSDPGRSSSPAFGSVCCFAF
jgi:actin cytoskeleton-regulatory complex protein PAN1